MTQSEHSPHSRGANAVGSAWNRSILRGVRANDLSGKAGEIAAELEERLVRGDYRFGETLSIYSLAAEFGASRQPVSSAVLYLGTIGYLEIIPQVGCRVVSPSSQDVQDFYVLFARTEALIARFAAERHEAIEAEELAAIAEDLSLNSFQSSYDRRAMADGISIFHDRMSAMARSQILVDRISNQRRIFRFYLSQNRGESRNLSGPPQKMTALRKQLTAAIQSREVNQADSLMEQYILDDLQDWTRVV